MVQFMLLSHGIFCTAICEICHNFSVEWLFLYICFFFRWILQLDREGTLYYSTGPKWIRLEEGMGKHRKGTF